MAHERAERNAARASEKVSGTKEPSPPASSCRRRLPAPCAAQIAEQQERFKTSLIVDGFDLDAEMVESGSGPKPPPAAKKPNKYSTMISRRKEIQEQEQQQGGSGS